MSAFVTSRTHVDLIVSAGLKARAARHDGPLTWYASDPDEAFTEAGGGDAGWAAIGQLHRKLDYTNADEIGQMLRDENVRSVLYRYPDCMEGGDLPGIVGDDPAEPYRFKRLPWEFNAVQALKAIDCYEYQSCEHPEWHESEAKRFCDSLRSVLIHSLPGYNEAPWEWDEADFQVTS